MKQKIPYLKIKYSKEDLFKYLSHIDIMKILLRILQRAQIPFKLSQGYSPRPRVVFLPPLPLGIASSSELLFCQLKYAFAEVELQKKMEAIKKYLPSGIRLLSFAILDSYNNPELAEETYLLKCINKEKVMYYLNECLEKKKFTYLKPVKVKNRNPDLRGIFCQTNGVFKLSLESGKEKPVTEIVLDLNPIVLGHTLEKNGIILTLDAEGPTKYQLPSNGKWLGYLLDSLKKDRNFAGGIEEITRIGVKLKK
ncbi:TIGR03936 family radical SAM-associated protein [Candidatus Riflebacteria bacterium]